MVLATASVQIKYGSEFVRIITADEQEAGEGEGEDGAATAAGGGRGEAVALAVDVASGEELRVPFSLLVGADGGRSAVRREIGAAYVPQERIDLGPFIAETGRPLIETGRPLVEVAGLNQTTLILAYEMTAAGACPTLAKHADGEPWDPFDPG